MGGDEAIGIQSGALEFQKASMEQEADKPDGVAASETSRPSLGVATASADNARTAVSTEDGTQTTPLAQESKETKPGFPPSPATTDADHLHDVETAADEASRLRELQADVRDQDALERDISRQADVLLMSQANERDKKRLERTELEKKKLETQILRMHQRLSQPIGTAARVRTQNELEKLDGRLASVNSDLDEIQKRIDQRCQDQQDETDEADMTGARRLPNESRREYLIRTGKITPFSKMGARSFENPFASLHDALIDAEDERDELKALEEAESRSISHRHLQRPGFDYQDTSDTGESTRRTAARPSKRRRLEKRHTARKVRVKGDDMELAASDTEGGKSFEEEDDSASYIATDDAEPDRDEEEQEEEEEEDFFLDEQPHKGRGKRRATEATAEEVMEDFSGVDDGDEKVYQARLQKWIRRRAAARKQAHEATLADSSGEAVSLGDDEAHDVEEWLKPHPLIPDAVYDNGYCIPGDIFPNLFDYQRTGVQWLWELYQQQVGGIVGDEMGLGKTIQVIAFLAGLHHSKMLTKPVIVVCPATVMKQWVNEFHDWWPPLRVSILHTSGSGMINLRSESKRENALSSQTWDDAGSFRAVPKSFRAAKTIVRRVVSEGHVLVTTYSGLQAYAPLLIPVEWGVAILDEGHKIRNPNTSITLHCKELRTPHRIILSGTPMQNNLTELWSLFDFVFPMRLGTLVNFRNQFDIPIRQGGYANASNLQVQTAAKCAETLKDAVSPYLLQRFKADVAADLPKKIEQVLFCKLTKFQRDAYERFLGSDEMKSIMNGRRQALYGIDILRKICNHPDLIEHQHGSHRADYGNPNISSKMQVVRALLELWKNTGHKTLLFSQQRIMLDILEKFLKKLSDFRYLRMDGTTPIELRQGMVDEFNTNPEIHVFLLTTKVGGLGVNLTGADRVIIYDPDWNPSTDIQARERAWRLGQKRSVTIYRLMIAGTVEEKMYHRQIFKQFLTNKILKDPKQRQTFQLSDLHDLFSLGGDGPTETSQLFKDAEVKYDDKREDPKRVGRSTSREEARDESKKIRSVTGVSSLEEYRDESEHTSSNTPPGREGAVSNSEARLVESIFARSGVHSALEHDHIVNGKRVVRADPKIIEAEAKKVAAAAAEELRKAGEAARSVPIGTPTWTGQFGLAGRPADHTAGGSSSSRARRAGAGPSSASILANLASRAPPSSRSSSNSPVPGQGPSGTEFLTMIRDFIVSHGGAVYTKMLVDHFDRYCTTPQKSAQFKEMLKTIAILDQRGGANGRGKWSLRPEYAK